MPNSIRVLHRITQIPELIELICRHADPRSRTSLLRVSRSFFDVAAPIVWEKVSGVHNILTLLPGVTAVLPRSKQRSFNENGVMVVSFLSATIHYTLCQFLLLNTLYV